jgi:cupin fold WbuC family metalloprotein
MTGNTSVQFLNALAVDEDLVVRLAGLPFSATGTRRICLHEAETSPLHAMLVESVADSRFPGHYHSDSDEVTIVVKGCLEILVWDKGVESAPQRLELRPDGDAKIAFIPKHTPHITKALGGNCVYLEVKLGPFKKDALVQVDPKSLFGA